MSIGHIDSLFHPKTIAVVGASEESGSLGSAVMHNLSASGFNGPIFAVNAEPSSVMGQSAYANLQDIETPVDLVVVASPMKTVPAVIADCARVGAFGAILVSADCRPSGSSGTQWETKIMKAAAAGNVSLIGPHGLGVMCTASKLNASLAPRMPLLGDLAFVSQSRGICSAILDYSTKEKIGFSHFIGLGSMLDVDFGDIIDYLGAESGVSSILMQIETLTRHRHFMSAARAVSRIKPIIALRTGRTNGKSFSGEPSAGATPDDDGVTDAAFQRAGIVRVKTFEELFDTAHILSRKNRYIGPGLAILTNTGGPGAMAVDAPADYGMPPMELALESIKALDAVLNDRWNRGNPINIMANATPERYADAAAILSQAKGVQADCRGPRGGRKGDRRGNGFLFRPARPNAIQGASRNVWHFGASDRCNGIGRRNRFDVRDPNASGFRSGDPFRLGRHVGRMDRCPPAAHLSKNRQRTRLWQNMGDGIGRKPDHAGAGEKAGIYDQTRKTVRGIRFDTGQVLAGD